MGPNGILRKQNKFAGYFVSDWLATHDPLYETAMSGLDLEVSRRTILTFDRN